MQLVVLGMHRSGTSAVTGALHLMGAYFGPEGADLEPNEENPKGFWERRDFHALCNRLMRAADAEWWKVSAFTPEQIPAEVLKSETASFADIREDLDAHRPWVLKEPQLCLLLPVFLPQLSSPVAVLVNRDPLEIALSLQRRSGFPLQFGVALWEAYIRAALAASEGLPRVLVQYADLVSDPKATLEGLHRSLSDLGVSGLSMPTDEQIAGFVNSDLHRHRSVPNRRAEYLTPVQLELAGALDAGLPRAAAQSSERSPGTQDMLAQYEEAYTKGREAGAAEHLATIAKLEQRIQDSLASRDRHKSQVERQRARMTALEEQAEEAAAAKAKLDAARQEEQARRQAAEEQVQLIHESLEDARYAQERHEAEVTHHRLRGEALERRLRDTRATRRRLRRTLARAQASNLRLRKDVERETQRRRRVEKRYRRLQRRYERLVRFPVIRVALGLRRRARRLLSRTHPAARPPQPAVKPARQAAVAGVPKGKATAKRRAKSRAKQSPAAPRKRRRQPAPAQSGLPVGFTVDAGWLERLETAPPVTIVVPVYDAFDEVSRCLDSLVRWTSHPVEVLLIDDASPDPRIADLLGTYETRAGFRVLSNETNLGYTRTVNRGIGESAGDVVLLNSDTEVTPGWLQGLRLAAYSGDRVATATALSDNAGAFSVPVVGEANDVPDWLSRSEAGRAIRRGAARAYPETPTGSGFCFYIRRDVIDEIGTFDADAFPRGYGEENDFCMRAIAAGWRHVVDDATFVFHSRNASFGGEREALMTAGRAVVDERHPEYSARVSAFVHGDAMESVRATARLSLLGRPLEKATQRPRILAVLHEGSGGTPHTNRDLMVGLADRYEPFILLSNTRSLSLWRVDDRGAITELERWELDVPWKITDITRADFRERIATVLVGLDIELVHIRHLLGHTLDMPEVAGRLGIPVVVSFHDFYLSCPTVHLLDDRDEFCGGVCTPGDGKCRIPSAWLADAPHLKHAWVHTWRRHLLERFEHVGAFVTTSQHTHQTYVKSYPELADRWFSVIEHGRDLEQSGLAHPPAASGPVKILITGNIDVHKGADVLAAIKAADTDNQLELHFLGNVPAQYHHLGVIHGRYQRSEFAAKVAAIKPSFIGIFPIWPETYCHTLTEAWASGIPVLASDIGVLRERIGHHGGGWLIDHQNPQVALATILRIAGDREEWEAQRERATLAGIRSVADMADDYDALYRQLLAERRPLSVKPPVRVGLALPGSGKAFPPSTHVRVLRPVADPATALQVTPRIMTPAALLEATERPPVDAILVQRTAVAPEMTDDLLSRLRSWELPLVFEIDDNLFDFAPRTAAALEYSEHGRSMKAIAAQAALVTVSTEPLRVLMEGLAERVVVIPNAIDERLWFLPPRRPRPDRPDGSPLRVVYIGSKTHGDDLALLRDVVARVRSAVGTEIAFEVVGGEPDAQRGDWYTPVPIPSTRYPDFVRWLTRLSTRWDLALAPLADTPFNSFKSDLKHLEYGALRLPGVYSDVGPYAATVRHGETGLLTANTVEGWTEAVTRLCNDAALRASITDEALAYVKDQRVLSRQVLDYPSLLRSAAQAPR